MTPAPLSDEARDAIHEAMAALPDDDRLMLVEHYFEKATIEEIGRREGISDVAMGKRLEKAREKLKRGLAGAGFAIGGPEVSHALESVTTVTAPPGLIGSAIVSKAALVAAGGLAVGTKTYSIGIVIGTAMVFLILGAGSGYLVGARSAEQRSPQSGKTIAGMTDGKPQDRLADPSGAAVSPEKGTAANSPETGRDSASSKPNPAAARLTQFKKWHEEWKTEKWKTQAEYGEHQRKLVEQGAELRQILLKDAGAFLAFAKDPENASCLSSLFSAALHQWVFQSNGQWAMTGRAFTDEDVPSLLTEGLLAILAQGTEAQKLALMSFGGAFEKAPEQLLTEYRKYLDDPSGQVLQMATHALRRARSVTSEDLEVMKRNAEFSTDVGVRSESFKAVASARTPEALDWFFTQLLSRPDARTTGLIAAAIREEIYMNNPFPKEVEPRAAEAIVSALARGTDDYAHGSFVYAGLCLSSDHAWKVLEAAVMHAPTDALRRAAERILDSFRNGERNASRLWSEYYKSKK